jgi:hypothetical protein
MHLYGGSIGLTNKSGRSFKWTVYVKEDINNIISYFQICPCNSAKFNRFKLIERYFKLRAMKAHLASSTSINGQLWIRFKKKWDNWE